MIAHVFFHLGVIKRHGFNILARGIRGYINTATDCALHLNRNLHGVVDKPLLLERREGAVSQGLRVAQP